MRPVNREDLDEDETVCGLDYGITVWHLRMLMEHPWNGGAGYTPNEVAEMTLDQIVIRLLPIDMMKDRRELSSDEVAAAADEEGKLRVRLADGTVAHLPMTGKSMAQIIAEGETSGSN